MKTTGLFTLLFLALATLPAQANCVGTGAIRDLVASGQVVDVRTVAASLQAQGFNMRDASVCQSGGGYVYRVVAEDQSGRFHNLVVDGRTGRIMR